MEPLESFPPEWLQTVVVHHNSTNSDGDPVPGASEELDGCLFAPKTASDDETFSDVIEGQGTLFLPTRHKGKVTSTSQIDVTQVMPGRYRVAGSPMDWAMGIVVNLELGA